MLRTRQPWSDWELLALVLTPMAKRRRVYRLRPLGWRLPASRWVPPILVGILAVAGLTFKLVSGASIQTAAGILWLAMSMGMLVAVALMDPTRRSGTVLARLRRDRTARFERATRIRGDSAEMEALSREADERRKTAGAALLHRVGWLRMIQLAVLHRSTFRLYMAGVMIYSSGSAIQLFIHHPLAPCGGPVLGGALEVAALLATGRIKSRLRSTLRKLTCPDCTYPLIDLPRGLVDEQGEALPVGPRVCPECGCQWPLIPPALPDR